MGRSGRNGLSALVASISIMCGIVFSGDVLAHSITEFSIPTENSLSASITMGPDGNVWFAESNGNIVARITPAGVITEFPVPGKPNGIATGPDGNLWVTELTGNKVVRMTTSGVISEFPIPTLNSSPQEIIAGPDGAM